MGINSTVKTYGTTYYPPLERNTAELQKVTYGLNFPLGKTRIGGGFLKRESGRNLIRDSVKQLLLTYKGERIMLPNFGCNLQQYLFEPLTESTFESIKRDILYSFDRYIVGARIQKLSVVPYGDLGPAGGNSLKVTLVLKLVEEDLTVFDVEVLIK